MRKLLKEITAVAILAIAVLAIVFILSITMKGTDPAAEAAGKQGDRVWTATAPVDPDAPEWDGKFSGSGASIYGLAFPYDNNSQAVVYSIDATANATGVNLNFWTYDANVTPYTTTTLAFCGGTTNQVKVSSNAIASHANETSGISYFVIDDGAGNVAWGEFQEALGDGSYFTVIAGSSNFAQGAVYGTPDLSAVTFEVGSRVYMMTKAATVSVGEANKAVDNDQGLVAAPRGSPLLATMLSGTGDGVGSGVTLQHITVKYQ